MTQKGTKSKYEEYRDIDGSIDMHLVKRKQQGKKRYTDLEENYKRETAFREGHPQTMIQCPFCGFLTPKVVAVDATGKPKREPNKYIKYVKNTADGKVERRYAGVSKDELAPITVQYRHPKFGWHINPKESLPPSILKRVDDELYNDFKKILERTLNNF